MLGCGALDRSLSITAAAFEMLAAKCCELYRTSKYPKCGLYPKYGVQAPFLGPSGAPPQVMRCWASAFLGCDMAAEVLCRAEVFDQMLACHN